MKRITLLAVIVALFTINAAKAQVGVHVGFNIGTPYYPHRHVVYYPPAPVYYPPAPAYCAPAPVYYNAPVYDDGYYRRPVYVDRGYYGPRRVVYYNRYYHRGGYRRW
ncbi:hypothetical protein [Mucilaginibacter polytrichastri]|nr:hypothetical protein [Mucilaginibacter polytrichastri]SFS45559.1 hypothetical protein SAMN04487890_101602 [Mucilaginibacter polytrichastri]